MMRKRSWVVRITVMLALLALTAACGGDGGGGGGGTPPPVPLATGTFTKTPSDVATTTGTLINTTPYFRIQSLHTASTISGAGNITGMNIRYGGTVASAITCTSVTIKLGHTVVSALSTTFSDNVANGKGSATTVLSNGIVTLPTGSTGTWATITFTSPFYYNGVDNLVVDFERNAACSDIRSTQFQSTASNEMVFTSTPSALTGTTNVFHENRQLIFAGGDNIVDYASTGSNSFMFATYSKMQMLYTAAEINGSGPITGIGFHVASVTTAQTYTYTVKLAHVVRSALTSTFADNFDSGAPGTVANLKTFTVPAGIPLDDYFWLPLTGAFAYNGIDNLLVEVEIVAGSGNTFIQRNSAMPIGRSVRTTTPAAVTGNVDTRAYDTMFRFNGGTMDVVPINMGTGGDGFPFWNSTGGARQWLYLASELGTSGSINKLTCRDYFSAGVSTAQTYTDYKIVMSHLAASTLNATRANNLPSPITVYNGAISVPAGLLPGDYFSITLSTPFSYNGHDNLVVDISGTHTTGSGFACGYSTDAIYANRRSWDNNAGPNATTMALLSGLPAMRFSISK